MDSMPERDVRAIVVRIAAYVWAAPNTALGAVFGLFMLCLGGRVRFVSGAAEFHGGLVARALPVRFGAITFGHVILGISDAKLCACREHEHVHIRQYERWGPFFLPAYVASSLWQVIHRRRAYRDNYFERQAFAADANRTSPPAP